jgi:ferrous iron transport protein B
VNPPLTAAARAPLVALAGNPNTGKSALFNRLTGGRARVGNYPGVTVDRLEGRWRLPGRAEPVRLLDVPGTYSVNARSEEERLALHLVTGLGGFEAPACVLLVLDGTQLQRNLYLALQLIELELPLVVAVNLSDVLAAEGRAVDTARLSATLGVPVVAVSARTDAGLPELGRTLNAALEAGPRTPPPWCVEPGNAGLAADLRAVAELIPAAWCGSGGRRREALALWALLSLDDGDELQGVPPELRRRVEQVRERARGDGRDIDDEVISARYRWIETHAPTFLGPAPASTGRITRRLDAVLLHPWLGFPLVLGLMAVVFQSLFAWADPLIGAVEAVFGALGAAVESWLPAGFLQSLLVDGVIAGVGGVLVFLPQILLLFLFVALMEDSGYMARVAVLMDRIMRSVGLHGRAFVPMLSGLACAIPAVMATRTIERERDRFLTMMVVPLMTCSARLPVYTLMIAAIYPVGSGGFLAQGGLMAGMYLFSTLCALAAAAVLGRTVLRGTEPPLLLEMPPYRLPQARSVLRTMAERGAVFVREAGTVILVCTIGLWALLSYPAPEAPASQPAPQEISSAEEAEAAGEALRQSYAGRLGRLLEPAIEPLGFDWKIGVGLIGAFAAREVFVSTMGVVYGLEAGEGDEPQALRERLASERRPDGRRLYTPLVCLSLMVFFALAAQCMSTLAAVKRETKSWRWPLFLFGYMTALAYAASFLVYQGGRLLGFE